MANREISRFPHKKRPHVPGSLTTPDHQGTRDIVPFCIAFRVQYRVGIRNKGSFAARWLARALPCRRFAATLAGGHARLGADVVRYAFIVVDLHYLLLAGLPAHTEQPWRPEPSLAQHQIARSTINA